MNGSFKNKGKALSNPGILLPSLWLMSLMLLASCNTLKYVPEDKKLYTGADVTIEEEGQVSELGDLKSNITASIGPKPNSKFLGMRLGLWAHYKLEQGDSGFVVKFFDERFGEEPVYMEDINVAATEDIILNRCENNGFFYAEVVSSIEKKEKTGSVDYLVTVSQPYLLETYTIQSDSIDLQLEKMISESFEETELKLRTRFDTDALRRERERIDTWMKNRGYYEFNPDYLIFTTDTNQYDLRRFDLYLSTKKATPQVAKKPYQIRDIYVYPNYSVDNNSSQPADTVEINGVYFIQDSLVFRPELMVDYLTIAPGQFYDKAENSSTTRRLSSLQYYQFANVSYERTDTARSAEPGHLKASVLLTPGKKQDLRLELQGFTKSTNFAGPALSATYRNKNLWKGGEVLDITGSVSYETQLTGGNFRDLSSFQFRLNNSLIFPRFISPFSASFADGYSVPKTKAAIEYNLQDRGRYYVLNSFRFLYGYNWKSSRFIYQEINPLSLNYMNVTQQTSEFEEILEQNPFLARSFRSQFIPGGTYTFTYNEFGLTENWHEFFFSFGLDAAGNSLSGIHEILNAETTLFGLPYAQYVKTDVDMRHNWKLSQNSDLVTRIFAGAGFPYGNSSSLPYIKQYFSGGPNSVRAFQIRSIGPGSYNPPDTSAFSFFDQAGDIRFEFNTEWRFPIYSIVNGAFFVDAGNVWLRNENPALPGGKFDSEWVQDLALGTGFGIRLDISVLVIRLDIGHPLRYPQDDRGSYWVQNAAFNKLVWNFAIGYPF